MPVARGQVPTPADLFCKMRGVSISKPLHLCRRGFLFASSRVAEKVMMGRVDAPQSYREPGRLRSGAKGCIEDGP